MKTLSFCTASLLALSGCAGEYGQYTTAMQAQMEAQAAQAATERAAMQAQMATHQEKMAAMMTAALSGSSMTGSEKALVAVAITGMTGMGNIAETAMVTQAKAVQSGRPQVRIEPPETWKSILGGVGNIFGLAAPWLGAGYMVHELATNQGTTTISSQGDMTVQGSWNHQTSMLNGDGAATTTIQPYEVVQPEPVIVQETTTTTNNTSTGTAQ